MLSKLITSLLMSSLLGFCMWLSYDYSQHKIAFRASCIEQDLVAITPKPGEGPWHCIEDPSK